MNYNIIASGSSGNCTIIDNTIAIDMGISFKALKPYYKDLKIVFISHKHIDHLNKSTVKKLAFERPTLRFAVPPYLVIALIECGVNKNNIDVIMIGLEHKYKDFSVTLYELKHDVPNVGFLFDIRGYRIFYATDTSTLEHIEMKNCDLYLIEANYGEEEIQERINQKKLIGEYINEYRVIETHQSKEQATEWLLKNMGDNSIYEFMHIHKQK